MFAAQIFIPKHYYKIKVADLAHIFHPCNRTVNLTSKNTLINVIWD
jgi:hypothetical protein